MDLAVLRRRICKEGEGAMDGYYQTRFVPRVKTADNVGSIGILRVTARCMENIGRMGLLCGGLYA